MSFSVGFKPFAEMHTAHHMLMFGCQTPGENLFAKDNKYWYVLKSLKELCHEFNQNSEQWELTET